MCPACKQELRIEAHPTVKNTELMKYLIKLITPPGGIVLDPFMGSGSTGVACMRLELALKFIGVEQDADFYKTSLERLKIELPAQAFVEGA